MNFSGEIMVKITSVVPRSPAHKAGIREGDNITHINGSEINDILDFEFYMDEKNPEVTVQRDGRVFSVRLKKSEYGDSGLGFSTFLMDEKRRCRNNCIFCFIDQNPKGMRDTIYFKDDDERLSFLHGSYVTLTNLTEREIDRIIKMHISPINISVHTVNPQLRVTMMKNRFAGDVLRFIPMLDEAGIQINAQLVLCRNINDGDELKRSLSYLTGLKNLRSCACVPCGLTDHREGLCEIHPYDKESASEIIDIINSFGDKCFESEGERKVYASDEFYLLAGRDIPEDEFYEDYPQYENGVGMLRSLEDEFMWELEDSEECSSDVKYIATGYSAYPLIHKLVEKAKEKFKNLNCTVVPIENRFYGKHITVSGLLTGGDICAQLKGVIPKGAYLLLPCNMFKADEYTFLDDVTLEEVENTLGVTAKVTGKDGASLCQTVLLP